MSGLGGSEAGGLGDAGYGPSGPSDFGDAHSSSVAADLGFDIGTRGTSTAPDSIDVEQGQTLQGALAQALFDRLSQIDYTTPAGMAQGRFGLDSMSNLGLGRTEGLNPNNPTQSVDEMLNAQNFGTVLGYVAPAIASMVPGYGAISTIGRVGSGLLSGTMTPGQALSMGLAGALGAKTGLPSGIFEGLFEGNPGKAAGAGAQGGLAALTSALTGNPYAGAIASATLGPSLGRSVSEAVGGSSTKGGGLAGMLDQGLGTSNWGGLGGLPGAGPAPSTSTAPTGNVYGDAGVTQDISPVLAAIEQEAQQTQPAFRREMLAGRYGPIMQYEFGA